GRANERLLRAGLGRPSRRRADAADSAAACAVHQPHSGPAARFRLQMTKPIFAVSCAVFLLAVWLHAQPPTPAVPPQTPPQQPTEIETRLSSEGGSAPRLAIPDFIALSPDAETADAAKKIGQALWDDLNFER